MASIRKGWRLAVAIGAAALALTLMTSAFAQAPPLPPTDHLFFGMDVTIDGESAADGAVVEASNQDGTAVGSDTITDGSWMINVHPDNASSVSFTVNGIGPTASYDVVDYGVGDNGAGIAISVTTPVVEPVVPEEPVVPVEPEEPVVPVVPEEPVVPVVPEEPVVPVEPEEPEAPAALPNTGSGGLADTGSGFPLLPVALAISALVALSGVAVTRRVGISAR